MHEPGSISSLNPVGARSVTTPPAEVDALRSLNAEYVRQHPEEVARFLDGRSPHETTTLLLHAPQRFAPLMRCRATASPFSSAAKTSAANLAT